MVAAGVVVLDGGGGWSWWLCASMMGNRSSGGGFTLPLWSQRVVKIPDLSYLGGGGGGSSAGCWRCPACVWAHAGGGNYVALGVVAVVVSLRCTCAGGGDGVYAALGVAAVIVSLRRACASSGDSVCAALGAAAVVVSLRRAPVVCCAPACAAPVAASASVGNNHGWFDDDNLLQVNVFGIFVIGCLLRLDSCGSKLQVTSFLAIVVLTARHKSIGNLSNAPLLMVGWSMVWPSLLFPSSRNRVWFVIRVELRTPVQF
uniref:Uncharacterized protein n=1 Tax=Oryza glaberrima TaxID=4538 RepID=I1Q7K1_ORYGL